MEDNLGQTRNTISEDAQELASLLYDIYKESKLSDKVEDGQNNAQTNEN